MTATDVKKACSELPEQEQTKDSEFAGKLSRRHQEIDAGYKHTHSELLELHDKRERGTLIVSGAS
jgi:hypothetical protein